MAERGGPGTPGPGGPAGGGGPAVEGLLADQRRRGLRGESLRVEDYIARHPALRDDTEGLLDLIYNEVVLREERGEVPSLPEYRSRFPDLAGPLGDLFEVHGAIGADPTGCATTRAGAGSTSTYPAWPDPGWPALDGYEVVDVLGSGGMGIVYRARDLRHGVTVAVKTMRQVDAAAVSRFKQEFRALLDVSHPNLVTLYELISDGRQWFIVMEYVDGVGFLDHVRGAARPAGGDVSPSAWGLAPSTVDFPETAVAPPPAPGGRRVPAPPATTLAAVGPAGGERLRRALRGLACGLAALHQAGRLHRDIKPSNVMVTRQGRVVLMDFGLVTTPDRGAGEASTGGQVVGTAAYMAPEQAAGLRASEASDWYSVGVIIYEALTGRLPFSGPPLQVLMDKQRYEPPPPRELAPDAPDDLNLLCSELLHRDPGARPTSREVLERLGAVEPGGDGATGPPPSSRDFAFQAAFFSASAGTSSRAERSLSSVRRLWTRIDRPA